MAQGGGGGRSGGQHRGQGFGSAGRDGNWSGGVEGMYRSGDVIPQQGAISNPGIERALRDGARELSQMRQELREASPDLDREVQEALRELQKYDPSKIGNDPLLAERIRNTVLPAIEQLELQLRRKLDGGDSGQVRTSATERIPQGYAEAVADYFRRLSKGK